MVSLFDLLATFRPAFPRLESARVFEHVVVAWILCLRCRTLSEVWQISGLKGHYDAIYSLFASACWDWDELGALLCTLLLTHLLPDGLVTLVIDDTLCHKRGKRIAFGGIFLDPVLSSKSRKILRYGINYVVLALVIRLPFRTDRCYALPVLWRVFRKKGLDGHRKRTALAADLILQASLVMPNRAICLVADEAYINAIVLHDLPSHVSVIGPLSKKAALYLPPAPRQEGDSGRLRKKGLRLPTPLQLLAQPERLEEMVQEHPAEFARIAVLNGQGWSAWEDEVVVGSSIVVMNTLGRAKRVFVCCGITVLRSRSVMFKGGRNA